MGKYTKEALENIVGVFEYAPDAIAIYTRNKEYVFCNRAWKVFHGQDPDKDVKPLSGLVKDNEQLKAIFKEGKQALDEKKEFRTEFFMEERKRWVEVIVRVVEDVDPPCVVAVIRDMTDSVEAREEIVQRKNSLEELVRERTKELESIDRKLMVEIEGKFLVEDGLKASGKRALAQFMNVPVPIYIWKNDGDDFVLAGFNKEGLKFTEGTIARYMGIKASNFHKDEPDIINDLHRCLNEKITIEKKIRLQRYLLDKVWDLAVTYVFIPPDLVLVHTVDITERLETERKLARYRDQLEDQVNERTLQLEMTNMELKNEISVRKNVETALRESEEKYRFVAELVSDYSFGGILHPDFSTTIEWSGGECEKMTGYTLDELNGKIGWVNSVYPDDREKARKYMASFFSRDRIISEFRIIRKDGAVRWNLAYGLSLGKTDDGGVHIICAMKDTTARKHIEIDLENRNREFRVLDRIHKIFDNFQRDETILDNVMDVLMEECDISVGAAYLPVAGYNAIECRTIRGAAKDLLEPVRVISLDDPLALAVLDKKGIYVIEEDGSETTPEIEAVKRNLEIFRVVLFSVRFGEVLKAAFVLGFSGDEDISLEKRRFFDIIRNQLGLEFERCDLLKEQIKYEKNLKNLAGNLIGSIEEEKTRIALNLHDEIGQSIIVIEGGFSMLEKKIDLADTESLGRIRRIRNQIHGLTESIREVSYSLHPAMLEDLGLIPTIQWYIDKFVENSGINVTFETAGWNERIDKQLSLALYRVTQEAFTNIIRHADAKNVSLKLTKGYPDVIMRLEDDGKGFHGTGEEKTSKGLGIVGMRERINSLNGKFTIYSSPGRGTRIKVTLPLEGFRDGTDQNCSG